MSKSNEKYFMTHGRFKVAKLMVPEEIILWGKSGIDNSSFLLCTKKREIEINFKNYFTLEILVVRNYVM